MVKRTPPHWQPAKSFSLYPSVDKIFIPIVNESRTKQIQMSMTTAEAISFAERILDDCKYIKRTQEAKAGRK